MLVLTEIATYFGEKMTMTVTSLKESKRQLMLWVFFVFFFFRMLLSFPAARLSLPEWIELSAENQRPRDTNERPLCGHRNVLVLSVTARWKYSGELSDCRLPLDSLLWTSVERVFLKLLSLPTRFSKVDTIISARSCWSLWKFSLTIGVQ